MWISLGRLSGTESGYSLLFTLMETVPNGGNCLSLLRRQLFAHPKLQKKRQLFSLEEDLILQVDINDDKDIKYRCNRGS